MKTTVIQLEPHDDLVSVRDKMSWAKTERILLVWPPRRKVMLRPLDLVLLKRHAVMLGAQLGLAIRSAEMRRAGVEARIPVFLTSSEAQKTVWPAAAVQSFKRRRRRKRRNLRAALAALRWKEPEWMQRPAARIAFFAIGLLVTIALVVLIFLPSATIRLNPERENQSVTIPVTISTETSAVTLAGALPAREITVDVSGNDSLPASGKIKIPDKQAVGEVRFTNLTETATTIPEGTIILATDSFDVRFITTKSGATASGLGGIVVLPVRALEAGMNGNLPSDSLTTIEGDLGLLLAVTNEEPTGGGRVSESVAPSAADRSLLFERLSETLLLKAEEQINTQIPVGSFLLPNTLSLVETVDEIYYPAEGLAADAVTLDLSQTFHANYVSADDLQLLGNQILNASMPEGYVAVKGTLSLTPQGNPESDANGAVKWVMRASQNIEPALDHASLANFMLGKNVKAAVNALAVLSKNSESRIEMFPSWWPWLPFLPARINVLAG